MIDGVKINVVGHDPTRWLTDARLLFYTAANMETGELKDGTQVAEYMGLRFIITPSKKHPDTMYCSVRGSLHKYHNKGRHNADDFTFDQLKAVVSDLHQTFGIDPATSTLHGLEFGVNIHAGASAKSVLDGLVSLHGRAFQSLTNNQRESGKLIVRQQYRLKVYDKGKASGQPLQNIVRVEMKVNKMAYLKRYGIATLADLTERDRVQPLGVLLADLWTDVIFYDKCVNYKAMTDFEKEKLFYYAAPRNWTEYSPTQRQRAKRHFTKLMQRYDTGWKHPMIAALIAAKWDGLTVGMCTSFNPVAPPSPPRKAPAIARKCKVCSSDISHRRKGVIYCRKRCNNSRHAAIRKEQRHARKRTEERQLKGVLKRLHRTDCPLLISYRTDGTTYTDGLHQSEVYAPPEWAVKVVAVVINAPPAPLTFTSHRAKRLIRAMSEHNQTKKP